MKACWLATDIDDDKRLGVVHALCKMLPGALLECPITKPVRCWLETMCQSACGTLLTNGCIVVHVHSSPTSALMSTNH